MAKMPSWLRCRATYEDGQVVLLVHVRRWHPGFWWFVLTALWRMRRQWGRGNGI